MQYLSWVGLVTDDIEIEEFDFDEEEELMAEHNFQVGDEVRVIDGSCASNGRKATITKVDGNNIYFTDETDRNCHEYYTNFELLSKKGTVMNNPVTAITEINLTADDRLLRKYSLEESTGKPSTTGKETLMNLLWAEKRGEIANLVRKAIAAAEADVESITEKTAA